MLCLPAPDDRKLQQAAARQEKPAGRAETVAPGRLPVPLELQVQPHQIM